MEARRAKFSVDKEFEVGVDRGALSAAHATTLRGAAAAEALRESGDVPDGLLSKDALELRVSARAAVDTALRAGASHAELQRYGQSAKGMRIDLPRRQWAFCAPPAAVPAATARTKSRPPASAPPTTEYASTQAA